MASNTPNLKLLKKDPIVDGNDTFNIQTMLNDNWDKIDAAVGNIDIPDASLDVKGKVQLSSAVDSDAEDMAATPKAVKSAYDVGIAAQVTANAANSAAAAAQNTANAANSAAAEAQNTANAANTAAAVAQTTANAAKSAAAAAQTTANQAFTSGNERKAQMVAALVAKGVPATSSESWDTLIGKMDTVSQGEMVSLNCRMPRKEVDLLYESKPFIRDEPIVTIPAGVTKLSFLSDGITFNPSGNNSHSWLYSKSSSSTRSSGALYVGLKDSANNFFSIFGFGDAYYDPLYHYLHAFMIDLTGYIPSFSIRNVAKDHPGAGSKDEKIIPENFNYNGEMSLVFRSEFRYNFGESFKITREAYFMGTLTYS